jgi:probable HAF family extracellular repeat protein
MKDLGTLGGAASTALAINSDGDIVGTAQEAGGDFRVTEFSRFAPAANVDSTPQGTFNGAATCNNNRGGGELAGFVDFPSPPDPTQVRAFRKPGFVPLTPVLMATLGGSESRAFGMNENGDIVGSSLLFGDNIRKAFLFTGNATGAVADLGGTNSEARDINNMGRVVGWSDIPGGGQRAFLYYNGALNLGTLGGRSIAHAINDAGDVVGTSETAGPGSDAAFLYRNATMVNLNTMLPPNSGWNLQFANSINEQGQIVGYGIFNGQGRAFLLDPDRTAPVVKPTVKRLSTTRPRVTIRGTATDEGGVQAVQVQVGKGPFRTAQGTTQWSFKAKLRPGKNRITVRAVDGAGNLSRTSTLTIIRS